jgi:uncharacterized protein (DUF697 family)
MKEAIRTLINRTSVVSAGLGVLLSPFPFLDELALVPVYGVLSTRIAREHKLGWNQTPWSPIAKSTGVGLVARAAVNITFVFVPGAAAVVSAATAAALTEILGQYVDDACSEPSAARALSVRDVMAMLKKTAQAVKEAG